VSLSGAETAPGTPATADIPKAGKKILQNSHILNYGEM